MVSDKKKEYNSEYYKQKKSTPEQLEKAKIRAREYRERMKDNPEYIAKQKASKRKYIKKKLEEDPKYNAKRCQEQRRKIKESPEYIKKQEEKRLYKETEPERKKIARKKKYRERMNNNYKNQCKYKWTARAGLKETDERFEYIYNRYMTTDNCEFCNHKFNPKIKNQKCMDHCHLTGHFRNVICNSCNSKRGAVDRKRMLLCLDIHRYFTRI